jgi:tetratricopeptide (TPR) repeat protein
VAAPRVSPLRLAWLWCLVAPLSVALISAAASAQASSPSRHGLAIATPRAEHLLVPMAEGTREWLHAVLATAGVEMVARKRVLSASKRILAGGRSTLGGSDAPALAAQSGAALVLLSELHYQAGQAEVRLRLHDGTDGSVVSAAVVAGSAADLGVLLRGAAVRLLEPTGIPTDTVGVEPAPSLGHLGSYGRALGMIRSSQLVGAWRELKGVPGRTAEALRKEIEWAAVRSKGVSPAERSRLSSLRGTRDRDWLKVREALVAGRDPVMLVAGADAARSKVSPERALKLYNEAARLDPGNRDAQLGRAAIFAASGRHAEAAAAYRTAIRLAPEDPGPYEELSRLPELAPEERARLLIQAGDLRAERLELKRAQRAYRQASELDGNAVASTRGRAGELHERVGNRSEALLAYQEAVSLDPGDTEALVGLGRTRRYLEDYAGAEQALLAALAIRPNHQPALEALGTVLVESSRPAEAIPHLEKAVSLEPSDARSRRSLARAHRAAGNPEAALEVLTPGAVAASDRVILLQETSAVHASEGRLDEAELHLQKAIAIEPEDPPLRVALAKVYEQKGDAAAAEEQWALAASLGAETAAPGSADATAGSGKRGSDRTGVAADFEDLIASFPTRNPHTRKPIGPVILLSLVEDLDWKQRIEDWVMPRGPDHGAIELLLIRGILEHFELIDAPPIPSDLESVVADLRAFSTDREKIAVVNDMLEVDATFLARLTHDPGESAESGTVNGMTVEVRLLGGRTSEDVFILANAQRLPDAAKLTAWNWKAFGPYALLLVLLSLPVIRGWGTLVVKLEYESAKGTKGFFSIKLTTKPDKAKKEKAASNARSKERVFERKVRSWSRYSRYMVGRETRFWLLPTRRYYVGIHGLLQDEASKEVIGNYVEEKTVLIRRGVVEELTFDFRRTETSLEVRLIRSEEEATPGQALVALRGCPETLRYVREETALIYVGKGTHVVVVAYGDRVFEQEITVDEFEGVFLTFLLYGDESLLFSGCAEAATQYIHGDLNAASATLAANGQTDVANLLRGEYYKRRGDKGKAAAYLQAAGRLAEAAELVEDAEYAGHSANLYLQAGEFQKAGERYEQVGEHLKAAEAFEAAYSFNNAIENYRKAGLLEKVIELIERTGDYLEAAHVALELEDDERAIRNLQLVGIQDSSYGDACRTLAEVFARRGEFELAVQKAEDAVTAFGEAAAPLEVHEQLGTLLEGVGRLEEALETFERIRKRDYQYPNVAEKIEFLRSQLSEQKEASQATGFLSGGATQIAGPPQESRYELLEEIGRGGMGVVYKARDRRLGRVVALKRLPENLRDHPTAVQLFLREARAAAALNHRNIVTLFDADQENDNYYITMELLEGFSFDAILKKRGKLTARDAVRLAVQVAAGLQYAHDQRIVHRDIKTANLYFTKDRTVKIMDFGLAKMIEEVRRATTVVAGTPYYMAPEQAAGESVDHRADLYAFGVTLFELVTGRVPFGKGDVTFHHRHTPPPDPRSHAEALPDSLAEMVLQLMAKSPDDRYQTTAEVRQLLSRILQELPAA